MLCRLRPYRFRVEGGGFYTVLVVVVLKLTACNKSEEWHYCGGPLVWLVRVVQVLGPGLGTSAFLIMFG